MEFGCGQLCVGNTTPAPNVDLSVSGITLANSPFWTFVLRGASNARIDNVRITTPPCDGGKNVGYDAAPNTDGFNIGHSDGVLITNSYVRNRDDCVPLFPPISNIVVKNITCECGNGLVPCVWPRLSLPGHGGNITNVSFDGAKFVRSSMAIAMKSLESFVGTVRNVTYANFVLEDVGQAVMINVYGQNNDGVDQSQANDGSDSSSGLDRGRVLESSDSTTQKLDSSTQGAQTIAFGESTTAEVQRRRCRRVGSGVARYTDIRIVNVTGTADSPGKITCDSSEPCEHIVMTNVTLTVPSSHAAYTCSNAFGTFSGCDPKPCLSSESTTPS